MIALVDFAVFVMMVAGAFFLGMVGLALYKELTKGNDDEHKE